MPSYDFKQLSPHDFEQLARDLIQARDGIVLESFKSGRDQGIDFRHSRGAGHIIVQCKHYVGTGFPGLLADLKKEAAKVAKLKPTRYMLMTSVGLTPANKTEIQRLFGPALKTGDIIGQDDCNNLLGLHGDVEQRHYKLWLASRVVLDRVVHNASVTYSEFDVERVHREICRYVRSAAYPRAIEMLNADHVAIISGVPGVGKTTLARMILYSFLEQGYEAVSILTDFQTGRERYQPGKKQIFYFDDFIGATFLGERASAFTRNEDRAILDFIEMVRRSPTARLVMTTREHILRQAIAASEKLKQSQLVDSRCVLEIGDYTKRQRAEILYNHICFSDLPDPYRDALLKGGFYHEILDHAKFNPRLIEWLSSFRRVRAIPPSQYQEFVRNLLDDPAEIWRHAYEEQISDAARSVLLALYSFSGKCGPLLLEEAFRALHAGRAQRYSFKADPSDWRRTLSELGGSFIRPGIQIEVIDPSVLDMLNRVLSEDTPNAIDIIESAVRFEQARRIWSVACLPGNETILHRLGTEEVRLVAALQRLLSAPREVKFEGGTAIIDDSAERRVTTMLGIAEKLRSAALASLVQSAMDRLLEMWRTHSIDISDGVGLLQKVESSKFVFRSARTKFRARVLDELAAEAADGCSSNDLRELVNVIEPEDQTGRIETHIQAAVHNYRRHYFPAELDECKSETEFDGLDDDVATIAESTGINLEGPLHAIFEKKEEFLESESRYEDQQYEEWKDARHEIRADERALDDLFDSLRPRGPSD